MEYERVEDRIEDSWGLDWNRILKTERVRRGVTLECLSAGLMDRRTLANMEDGTAGWEKIVGDVLFQRLGIYPGHFECMAAEEELLAWREREQICRCIFSNSKEARKRLGEMESNQENLTVIERQFLEKLKTVELIRDGEPGETVRQQAEQAVYCTMPKNWEKRRDTLLLAPAELEAVLLLAYGELLLNCIDRALFLQQWVWSYPAKNGWKQRMQELILPAAALVGMRICRKARKMKLGYSMGRQATEILSQMISQRYLYPLLCEMEGWKPRTKKEREWAQILRNMKNCLESLYAEFQKPDFRLWQTVTMAYTYNARDVLYRLRKASRKPLEGAVSGEDMEDIISPRHLARVESGKSNITEKNYKKLLHQYGRTPSLRNPLTMTDSLETLQMSREISRLTYLAEWDKAREMLLQWAESVDMSYPINKQYFLSKNAIIDYNQHSLTEKECIGCLEMALGYTIPQFLTWELRYWPFQREEVIIINNIAARYEQIGQMEKALTWLGVVRNVLEDYRKNYDIMLSTYDLVVLNQIEIIGNLGRNQEAIISNTEEAGYLLDTPSMTCMGSMLYDRAWNRYEVGMKKSKEEGHLRELWKRDYVRSVDLESFFKDYKHLVFLKEREEKYLDCRNNYIEV